MKELWNKIKIGKLVLTIIKTERLLGKMSKMLSKTLLKMSKRKQMRSRRK